MPPALTTVARCGSPLQATAIRDALEAEGIRAFVVDGSLPGIHPFLAPALGGIRVDVETPALERATALLRDRPPRGLPEGPPSRPGETAEDSCPACGRRLPESSDACTACGWSSRPSEESGDPGPALDLPPRSLLPKDGRDMDPRWAILLGFFAAGAVGFFVVHGIRSARISGGWQPSSAELIGVLVPMAIFGAWLLLRKRR